MADIGVPQAVLCAIYPVNLNGEERKAIFTNDGKAYLIVRTIQEA